MPAWWGKKSGKNKEESQQTQVQGQNPYANHGNFLKLSTKADATSKKKVVGGGGGGGSSNEKDRPRSFDEGVLARNSPRNSKDIAVIGPGSSSGFSGFDSDSVEKIGHPLPRPSISSMPGDQVVGLGSGSGSVSSVSSSGSSDDHHIVIDQVQFGGSRGQGDIKFKTAPRSPGPGSRGPTSPTSPLHMQLSGMSLESPTGRQEDGKSQCHQLPLPPGSPTNRAALPNSRIGAAENSPATLSKWKKGRLLGRGTFGHVYLGFNR